MKLRTKYAKYNIINTQSNDENEDEFSCRNDCRHCLKCEIGYMNVELMGGY